MLECLQWLIGPGKELTAFAALVGLAVYLVKYITDAAKSAQDRTLSLMAPR